MTAPAAPLRLAVAGLGRAFTLMLPTFLHDPRVRLVAASDPRPEAREQFTRSFGAPAFERVEPMVEQAGVECVYVATPHALHEHHVQLAVAAGRHVLVEKPMALSVEACDRMIAAGEAAGVRVVVGHSHSFDTPYRFAREALRRGDFGPVRLVHAVQCTDFLYRPRRPEELDTALGGGVVFSQAAHQVDIVRLLVSRPALAVHAFTGAWDPQRPTEGAYGAHLHFEGGAVAALLYSGYGHYDSDEEQGWIGELGRPKAGPGAARALHVAAAARSGAEEEAEAAAEAQQKHRRTFGGPDWTPPPAAAAPAHQHFGPVTVFCEGADLRLRPDRIDVYRAGVHTALPLPPVGVPRVEVIDELWAAVREGVAPPHDGRWARETLRVCLAMLESARRRQVVRLGG